jgi:hypothetical protein
MIVGINRVIQHEDKEFHLQAEDLGVDLACFEVRVYQQGTVLWRKRIPYAELTQKNLPKQEMEDELRSLMEKTLHTVQAAIARGKLPTG